VDFTVPIILMVLCIAIVAVLYFGGFAEENRLRRG